MLLTNLSTMKLGFAGKRAFQGPSEGLMKNTFMANPSKKARLEESGAAYSSSSRMSCEGLERPTSHFIL